MVTRRVEISLLGISDGKLSRTWLRKVALRTLDVALPQESCQLSLAICDDDTIRRLNRQYRGVDEVTDVLAFSSHHPGSWEGGGLLPPVSQGCDEGFILPPKELPYLGEIIISYPQMSRQAASSGNSPEREMALLVVHGVLHLLGYDHQEPRERAAIEQKEREALDHIL